MNKDNSAIVYLYAFILGSYEEALEMDTELRSRDIRAEYFVGRTPGHRGYRFPAEDAEKLPKDDSGPYFGNDDSGVGLKDESFALLMFEDIATTGWIKI